MVDERLAYEERVIHIRFEGQSRDVGLAVLDVGEMSSDQELRQALARHLDVSMRKFALYVVERHVNGNVTVRPEAVFG